MKNRNKRFTSVVAASMALAAIAPVAPVISSFAADVTADTGLDYAYIQNGIVYSTPVEAVDSLGNTVWTTTITDYVANQVNANVTLGGTVVLPDPNDAETADHVSLGKTVNAVVIGIVNNAFENNPTIKNVTIDPSVETIGTYAFAGCTNLASVTWNAVNGNKLLNYSASIGAHAFEGVSTLKTVTLSGAITSIDNEAFSECSALSSVTLPESLLSIGEKAFYGDSKITSIELPSKLQVISEGAFNKTGLVGEVVVPASVTTVGANSFATIGNNLTLNFEDIAKAINWKDPVFGADNVNINNYKIYGTETSAPAALGADASFYVAAPEITVTIYDKSGNLITDPFTVPPTATTVKEGCSLIRVNVEVPQDSLLAKNTITLYVNDKAVQEYTEDGTYDIKTPTPGIYKIVAKNAAGVSSVAYTVQVLGETSNRWTNDNLVCADVEYGQTPAPTGLTSYQGSVRYVYSTTYDGTYTSTVPTTVGTYWVKGIVDATSKYIGLESEPVQFEIYQATNEWTEELTVTDGEPSAEAKFGTVTYLYSDTEDGEYTTDVPEEPGTYYVIAVVAETDNWTGLESDPVEFTIEEINQGWVQNEDGTYSYQDGSEWLMNGIYELPIENESEETADFWFVDGVMQKGWYESNSDKQYYFSSVSGAMLKNRWVSVDKDGNYVDWRTDRDAVAAYYYVNAEGKVVKDVFKYDQACTYGGEADGHYYAFAKDGAMLTGFVENNGKEYYFSPATGIMKTGWAKIDGKWYYFAEDGAMAKNETIDGWYVDADGVWDGK